MTEDEMVGWHCRLDGHEFEQAPGVGDGLGSLACFHGVSKSWTVKKAERHRIDAFDLWCQRKLESPLDCKESQPIHPKGDQSWVFIGRINIEGEIPILWPPDGKS